MRRAELICRPGLPVNLDGGPGQRPYSFVGSGLRRPTAPTSRARVLAQLGMSTMSTTDAHRRRASAFVRHHLLIDVAKSVADSELAFTDETDQLGAQRPRKGL